MEYLEAKMEIPAYAWLLSYVRAQISAGFRKLKSPNRAGYLNRPLRLADEGILQAREEE